MAELTSQYFLKWVESDPARNGGYGGGGGPNWVEDNVEGWINVAGSILGESVDLEFEKAYW